MRRSFVLVALLLPLCACAPRATIDTTQIVSPSQGPLLRKTSDTVSTAAPVDAWWTLYDDATLGHLVQDALHDNYDLQAATARIAQARSILKARQRARLPSTAVSAGAGYGSTLDDQLAAALDDTSVRTGMRYDAGLDFSWDTGLDGRLGASVRAAHAHALEAQAQADGVRIDVAAETARAYIDVCGYAARVVDAQQSLALLTQSVALQQKLLAAGAGNRLDVVRTQALAEQTAATLPALQSAHDNAIEELAVLLGKSTDALPPRAADCHAVPQLTAALPTGDVDGLLKRRPDVRAADDHLQASTAGIDIATSALYPSLSIGAQVLSSAPTVDGLDAKSSMVWRIGPLLSWSFPNVAVARARIAGARGEQRAALALFDQAILRAIADVRVALSSYEAARQHQAALQAASDHAATALRLAQRGRALGAVDALDLLDAERSDVAARLALTASRANVATAQVGLFRALGGGWQTATANDTTTQPRSGHAGTAP